MIKKIFRYFTYLIIFFLAYSCANVVAPSGGPKDITPPEVLRSTPENHSTHFKSGFIRIYFDEYIKFNNLNSQLMISPPMNPTPEISIRGKSIIINLPDSLAENTTYNLYFGDAITDITEGNAIKNFQYVFSTGSYLDSMSVNGTVLDAYSLKPIENALVMLYDSYADSLPYLTKPNYITKTNKSGTFSLNNLRNIDYKIFALDDANNNFLYDLPNEKIAFLDSIISPDYVFSERRTDSITGIYEDSSSTDSIKVQHLPDVTNYILYMFQEFDSTQVVLRKALESRGLVSVVFKFPVNNFKIDFLNIEDPAKTIIKEFNTTKDTLKMWISDTSVDSLMAVVYNNDSILDTLSLSLVPRVGRRAPKEVLNINSNVRHNSDFDFFKPVILEFSAPIDTIYFEHIKFFEDSVLIEPKFVFIDSIIRRFLMLDYTLKENTTYQLIIPDSTAFDFLLRTNDSTNISFSTKGITDYGNLALKVSVKHEDTQYIIELIDDKDKTVKKEFINGSGIISFPQLKPGNYTLKTVHDKNANARWDTGRYLKKLHPERVYVNKTPINIRGNWDIEIEWAID